MAAKKAAKLRKPTHADAHLALKLYDLRREAEMRKARNFMVLDFHPRSAQDVVDVINAFGSQENAWFRQWNGYWEMAATLVSRDLLHPDLFYASSGEPYLVFAKIGPFIAEVRRAIESPGFLAELEKTVNATQAGRDRLALMHKRVAAMRARASAAKRSA